MKNNIEQNKNEKAVDFEKLKQQVKEISIKDFLSEMGYQFAQETSHNYKYLSPLRSEKTPSFVVSKSKNRWVDFGGDGKSNDLIGLARKIWGTGYRETILRLCKKEYALFTKSNAEKNESKNYVIQKFLPEVKRKSLLSYLRKRGIDPNKVKGLVGEIYFVMNDIPFYSVAFKNDLGGYELRSDLKFLGKIGLLKKHFTHIKRDSTAITVFEGFIDFLSLQSYRSIKTDILVLNSCCNAPKAIPVLRNYEKAYLMLDNDKTGDHTTNMIEEYLDDTKDCRYLYQGFNDVNEWILSKLNEPSHDPKRA